MTLTIDKFGRVLIPKTLRQLLKIEPGDEIEVQVDSTQPSLRISPIKKDLEYEITYTDWGFPMIRTSGSFPEDYDTAGAIKENYQDYFDRKFGSL